MTALEPVIQIEGLVKRFGSLAAVGGKAFLDLYGEGGG